MKCFEQEKNIFCVLKLFSTFQLVCHKKHQGIIMIFSSNTLIESNESIDQMKFEMKSIKAM